MIIKETFLTFHNVACRFCRPVLCIHLFFHQYLIIDLYNDQQDCNVPLSDSQKNGIRLYGEVILKNETLTVRKCIIKSK